MREVDGMEGDSEKDERSEDGPTLNVTDCWRRHLPNTLSISFHAEEK